ncbi:MULTISPECIES: hypothetical protein [Sphingobium]|uniref:hypothetical protein n=1 Tax=Sphingobium TaxID=165695 RepID=UPI000A456133|nr:MULTISPECIES: hypothetical protein [Sphingobium]
MGYHDDERDAAAAAWHRKAEYENYRCSVCGEVISYDDREQYFGTKACAYHAHQARKDD